VKYEALAFSSAVARQAGTLYDAHKKARFERAFYQALKGLVSAIRRWPAL
jgi:hypothetical protein